MLRSSWLVAFVCVALANEEEEAEDLHGVAIHGLRRRRIKAVSEGEAG